MPDRSVGLLDGCREVVESRLLKFSDLWVHLPTRPDLESVPVAFVPNLNGDVFFYSRSPLMSFEFVPCELYRDVKIDVAVMDKLIGVMSRGLWQEVDRRIAVALSLPSDVVADRPGGDVRHKCHQILRGGDPALQGGEEPRPPVSV